MSAAAPQPIGLAVVPGSRPVSRRRASTTPGFYTRAQVEADLGLSATDRDTFERAGIIGPQQRRARGDTRPLLYSASDLAVARLAMSAHRLGVRGEPLRRLVDAVRLKQRRLVHGWNGTAILDADGDVELLPDGRDLEPELSARAGIDALLVIRLSVPELADPS